MFSYRQLVLATGAQPIRVPIGGDAADQVQSINSLADFSAFHAGLTGAAGAAPDRRTPPRPHVLIMGAGLIGCEFANDLAASGYQVSVADPSSAPMATLLPAPVGTQLSVALARLGVHWHLGATVKAVHRLTESAGPALQVVLSDGQVIQADRVLSAIGLRADTALARAAGLVCARGIVVDATLQTSKAHIYALGDGAQYATGERGAMADAGAALAAGGRSMPYVMPIMSAARALAAPAPGTAGAWCRVRPGQWQFIDRQHQVRGFVLTGPHTAWRAEHVKLVLA